MILNEAGEKCSPKDKANEIIATCLEQIEGWIEANQEDISKMTDRELDLLDAQLLKQRKRCWKILGITEVVVPGGEVEQI